MKICKECNGKQIHVLEISANHLDNVDIFPSNEGIDLIDIMQLPNLLHAHFCNNCKKIVEVHREEPLIVDTIYCGLSSTAKEIGEYYNQKGHVIFQSTVKINVLDDTQTVKRLQIVKKRLPPKATIEERIQAFEITNMNDIKDDKTDN
ncbi:hypothetical protein ACQKNB_12220 [Lysinibacillus xylanilyticus]|uniref:hypothetical protein n=1 Tax=Lysinibacillus xylanilyticus TaxID=582475 RepID=UPI003D046274